MDIKGLDTLTKEQQQEFKAFYTLFTDCQDVEITPIAVAYVEDYIRFDYERYDKEVWLHVKNNEWW